MCGSVEVDTTEDLRTIRIPHGSNVVVSKVVNTCRVCGESGDFAKSNDERIGLAVVEAVKTSVPRMLELLGKQGLSMAYIERALELPARTTARWKSGECSAAAVALLRTLATFPWVLEVAESGFDTKVANKAIVARAANILDELAHANHIQCQVSVESSPSSATVNIELGVDVPARGDKQPIQQALYGPKFSLLGS
jgi:hypothetical protein